MSAVKPRSISTFTWFGVRFDGVSDSGVDFSQEAFAMNITSDLSSGYNNSAYLFVHSKQSLVFGKEGIQVLS